MHSHLAIVGKFDQMCSAFGQMDARLTKCCAFGQMPRVSSIGQMRFTDTKFAGTDKDGDE